MGYFFIGKGKGRKKMVSILGGKKEEKLIPLSNIDAVTCAEIKGFIDQSGNCVIRAHEEGDRLVIEPINYLGPAAAPPKQLPPST